MRIHFHNWELYKLCYKYYYTDYEYRVDAIKIYKCFICGKVKEMRCSNFKNMFSILVDDEIKRLKRMGYIPYEQYELEQVGKHI